MKKYMAAMFALLVVAPAPASAWWNDDWGQRRKITLETQNVKAVTEEVKRAPVLVRLHSGVLDFSQVKPDGSDLRFVAGDDKTPLTYHIERFDPTAELALIWVDMPAVSPGKSQDIWLYYGNKAAKPVANAAGSYDGEQSLVYHFSDGAGPVDQTANGNKAGAFTAKPSLEGLIASGAVFQPTSQLRISPSASLSVAAGGAMTFSAWIKPAAEGQPADAVIYTKLSAGGDGAPARLVLGLRGGMPYVKLVGDTGPVGEALGSTPLASGSWAHLAVVAGDAVTLYANGTAIGTIAAKLPALAGEDVIGATGGLPGFAGDIDEVSRANAARSASAIALAASSQDRSATLVNVASEAEAIGSGSQVGYIGILFGALTLDAWVVIGILGVMLAIALWVMVSKALMLRKVEASNKAFNAAFRIAMERHGDHDGLQDETLNGAGLDASIGNLFHIAQRELARRLTEIKRSGGKYALAPQSIAAIRAALDAGHARLSQKLNKQMVLLTIAISGGPFLGLLGTVIGVMITFAGVAAAGDVNINAIAPGIAAALLATVAGLAVAIPSLFGYNYLLSRIEEIDTENRIFIDELEKRIAETYRGASVHPAIAAE